MTTAPRPARSAESQAALDAMGQRRYEQEVDAQRARLRITIRGALECVAWCAVGLAAIAWALHSTDVPRAKIVFAAGVVVGDAGVLITMLRVWLALDGADDA